MDGCHPGRPYRGNVDVCKSFCRDHLYGRACFPGVVQGCACPQPMLKTDDGHCRVLEACTCYEPARDRIYQPGQTESGSCSTW